MRIVIDIPEDVYTRLFDNGIQDNEIAVDDVCKMARAIRLGTPLDKIRAEMMKLQTYKMFEGEATVYVERTDVLAIIDKYKAENIERQST